MIPLAQKIDQLKARYQGETTIPPYEILGICDILFSMLDQARADIGVAFEEQVRTNQRLHALEKVAPGYQEPRG